MCVMAYKIRVALGGWPCLPLAVYILGLGGGSATRRMRIQYTTRPTTEARGVRYDAQIKPSVPEGGFDVSKSQSPYQFDPNRENK